MCRALRGRATLCIGLFSVFFKLVPAEPLLSEGENQQGQALRVREQQVVARQIWRKGRRSTSFSDRCVLFFFPRSSVNDEAGSQNTEAGRRSESCVQKLSQAGGRRSTPKRGRNSTTPKAGGKLSQEKIRKPSLNFGIRHFTHPASHSIPILGCVKWRFAMRIGCLRDPAFTCRTRHRSLPGTNPLGSLRRGDERTAVFFQILSPFTKNDGRY